MNQGQQDKESFWPVWIFIGLVLWAAKIVLPIPHLFTRTRHGYHYYNHLGGVGFALWLAFVAYGFLWFFNRHGLNTNLSDMIFMYGFPVVVFALTIVHQERSKRHPVPNEQSSGLTWPEYWGWRWAKPWIALPLEAVVIWLLSWGVRFFSVSMFLFMQIWFYLSIGAMLYVAFSEIRVKMAVAKANRDARRIERRYSRPERYR